MRTVPWLLLLGVVVLAGCNGLSAERPTAEPTETVTPAQSPSESMVADRPDPATDRIGWENGYWHNETLAVTNSDGLNKSEREAVVARTMARVEVVRDAEFTEPVPVETISRGEFGNRSTSNLTAASRTFDNTKFEAMFFVGEDTDSVASQQSSLGSSVLGFYDPNNDSIKLVTDSGQPQLDAEGTLAHELVHALQDQRHNLSRVQTGTRDAYSGRQGLVEGEANFVQDRYERRYDDTETYIERETQPSAPPDIHWGLYLMQFFPYSDGPGFVHHLHAEGGWEAVDAAFDDKPASAEQVIYPDRYGHDPPVNVSLSVTTTGGWERVRPDSPTGVARPDYATLGQSVLSSMVAYTVFDRPTKQGVVSRGTVVTGDRSDPLNYNLSVTEGWEGDRMYVYRNDPTAANETAYVWRIEWDSPENAQEFADGYRELLDYWGGKPTDQPDTWRIPEEPSGITGVLPTNETNSFADAFRIRTDGSTVTIVNAPTTADLNDLSPRAEP